MKSVGEAMAIGRTIHESCKRRWRPWKPASPALTKSRSPTGAPDKAAIIKALGQATPDRLRVIAQAMRHGF